MAKLYGEIAAKSLLTLDKSFARANGQPLDASEVYYSLEAAKTYAATAQAYIGQKIVVVENGVVTHYGIEDAAGNLKELGSKPVGDGNSIVVAEDGTVSLKGVGALVFERDILGEDGQPTGQKENVQYQPLMTKSGLVWVEPSKTTVEGLVTLIDALTKRVDTAEADIEALETAVGVASKPESTEGANDAVVATGLYKAVEDEAARAKAAEEVLDKKIQAIDFIDSDELATALEPYAKTTELPVTGIAANDKVLSLTDKLVAATISLGYDEDNKAIKLYGKDNAELGSVDATPFIKDGMLHDVEYNADTNTLTFTWNTDAGETKTDTVVLSDIIEPYTAGVGLELVGNEFKAKLAEGSESFLTITADGIKLAGITSAIATAKEEAIEAAATAAADIYATQTALGNLETAVDERLDVLEAIDHTAYTTNAVFNEYKTTVENTYATIAALDPVAKDAANAKTAVGNLETRFDEIVAVGGEPNAINKIQVNGSELTITDKTVNITVPTKTSDLTDDTGFDARITAAQNQADKGVNDAATAQTKANKAATAAAANATEIDTLNTTVAGHTTTLTDHGTRIGTLENKEITHTAEYTSLKSAVEGNTAAVATKAESTDLAKANTEIAKNTSAIKTLNETTIPGINENIAKKADASNVYTKSEVDNITGTVEEGKTIVKMIEEAKSAATYDDTEVRGLISDNDAAIKAIYNKSGDAAATGVLATEIARVEGLVTAEKTRAEQVEGDHEDRISTMENFWKAADDPEGTIDKLAEIVSYIESDKTGAIDMAADIQMNKGLIEAIYDVAEDGSKTGVLVTEIARVEGKADANATAIAAINNADTGILAQAKTYTNEQIAAIPVATASALGLVKYDDSTIKMNDNKQLYVAKVSTDVLEQGILELVLNGGTALK